MLDRPRSELTVSFNKRSSLDLFIQTNQANGTTDLNERAGCVNSKDDLHDLHDDFLWRPD